MPKSRLASAGIKPMSERRLPPIRAEIVSEKWVAPTANIKKSAPKPVTNNYDRLLAILERNAASVNQEPELVARLRDAIRAIRSRSGERDQ
jgi:protein-tyrosine-phosphatase